MAQRSKHTKNLPTTCKCVALRYKNTHYSYILLHFGACFLCYKIVVYVVLKNTVKTILTYYPNKNI